MSMHLRVYAAQDRFSYCETIGLTNRPKSLQQSLRLTALAIFFRPTRLLIREETRLILRFLLFARPTLLERFNKMISVFHLCWISTAFSPVTPLRTSTSWRYISRRVNRASGLWSPVTQTQW